VHEESKRLILSVAQAALLHEVVRASSPSLLRIAERVAQGEVVRAEEADALVEALAEVMLGDDDLGLSEQGLAIDDLIGIVQQMSEDFYR
jgi:hypothetical protein